MKEDRSVSSALEAWENVLQTPELVDYFKGIFNALGITIEETGEAFTVYHTGDKFVFKPGINEAEVDLVVPLKWQSVESMIEHAKDGIISPEESWRIVSVLFTPLTKATLQNPALSSSWIWKLLKVEEVTHVYLLNPSGGEASKHTLIHRNGKWQVLEGLHDKPERIYRMTPEQSLTYQRRVFAAMQKNSLWGWWQFARFYRIWRESCSEKVA